MSTNAERLKAWRVANPEKYQAQRAAYAVKAAAARVAWREKNREAERAALMERRHKSLVYRLTKRYRVTVAQARVWVDSRPTRCEVCAAEVELHFDHSHTTTKPRGWLCARCNGGLGFFDDDPARLRAAADYLEERGP